jgi:hypothetical protein
MRGLRLDLVKCPVTELFIAYGAVMDELRRRGIMRSSNSPGSDYAELLFCTAFGWHRESNSATGHDAVGRNGKRYQIKGRRLTQHNRSRQLSAIRRLKDTPPPFDFLAGVLFDQAFKCHTRRHRSGRPCARSFKACVSHE